MSTRDKSGLGYGNKIHECVLSYEKEVLESVFDSRSSDVEDSSVYDRFAKVEGMHAVPPPMIGNYMPPKSDSDDEYVIEPSKEQKKPSFAFVNTVKHVKTHRETVKEQNTCSPSPKVNKRDWNGLMSKKMGLGYRFTKKACFVCGSFSHLIRDCDFHKKRMAKQVELNKKKVNTARQNSSSQAAETSNARKVNTARPIVNEIRQRNNFYKSHSPIRRPFNKSTTPKANFTNHKVNTAGDKTDDPQKALKNKGIVDSGCSRHMTGNKAYLVEYQDYNGGQCVTRRTRFSSQTLNVLCCPMTSSCLMKIKYYLESPDKTICTVNLENIVPTGGKGPNWLFDLDYLTDSMNYQPVTAENKANKTAGPKEANHIKSSEARNGDVKLMGNCPNSSDDPKAHTNTVNTVSTPISTVSPSRVFSVGGPDQNEQYSKMISQILLFEEFRQPKIHSIHPTTQILGDPTSAVHTRSKVYKSSGAHAFVSYIQKQRRNNHKDLQHCLFACFLSQIEPKKISQTLEDESLVDAIQEELLQFKIQKVWILVDLPFGRTRGRDRLYEVFAPVARIEATRIFLAFASYMGFIVYQMDVKSAFLYGIIDEEVGYRRGTIDKILFIKKDKNDIMLVQILKKFDFGSVKTASTPIKTQKPLTKDEEAADVDVHLYRSMIGSLMYLTASRPDIMFAVCACSRFQVTPKTSHLHAVKRIFRYLKGKPKLGLWYPRVSSFDLEAYSDSDYAGANLDRKSTTGGCQFLGRRLISWQCKKQTIVATSTTEAEYVAVANCCGQVLWIQNQMLDYGFNFMNIKIYIDNESTICIVKNPVFHSKTKHIEIRHHFIRDAYEKKLIQVLKIHTDDNVADLLTKAFDVSRFNFLLVNIGMINL
ncbi:putative ribonuclease H-like domain-containing protein [Tanacetum coccineum]